MHGAEMREVAMCRSGFSARVWYERVMSSGSARAILTLADAPSRSRLRSRSQLGSTRGPHALNAERKGAVAVAFRGRRTGARDLRWACA